MLNEETPITLACACELHVAGKLSLAESLPDGALLRFVFSSTLPTVI